MGRYFLTRDWPVFEVIPLFVPVWLLSAMMASESDERYAFLRTLPVPDRAVVKTKFAPHPALRRVPVDADGRRRRSSGWTKASPAASTLVYLTLLCAFGLLAVAGYQIGDLAVRVHRDEAASSS